MNTRNAEGDFFPDPTLCKEKESKPLVLGRSNIEERMTVILTFFDQPS